MKNFPWITLLISGLAGAVGLFGPFSFDALVWQQNWFSSGEWWRFLTGHITHAGSSHFVWDTAAFLLLGAFIETIDRRRFLFLLGATIILTDVALKLGGRFDLYCGLSGLDMAMFMAGSFQLFSRGRDRGDRILVFCGAVGVTLAVAKIAGELLIGEALFTQELGRGFRVAVEAHIAGALSALICRVNFAKAFRFRGTLPVDTNRAIRK